MKYLFNGERLVLESDWRTTQIMNTNIHERPKMGVARTNASPPRLIKQQYFVFPTNAIPAFSTDLSFPVWLAFLSGRYFSTNLVLTMPDCVAMGDGMLMPEDPKIEARVVPGGSTVQDYLSPAAVDFFNPGFSWQRTAKGPRKIYPYKPPFDKGFVSAKYAVAKWGTLGRQQYPAEAAFEVFNPQAPRADDPRPLKRRINVTVTTENAAERLDVAVPSQFLFDSNASHYAYVRDFTHTTTVGTPLIYTSDKGILGDSDRRFKNVVKDNDKRARVALAKSQARPPRSELFIWGVLGAVVAVPLVCIWLTKKQRKVQTQ
jgi:hypothetical protein